MYYDIRSFQYHSAYYILTWYIIISNIIKLSQRVCLFFIMSYLSDPIIVGYLMACVLSGHDDVALFE